MFPLKDDNPTELTPWLTVTFLLANVAVWLYLQGGGAEPAVLAESICRYGIVPADVTGAPVRSPEIGPGLRCPPPELGWASIFSSMFLHGSWLHLIGNMWFLWLFGNNVEDSMGHTRYLIFYSLAGVAAGAAHILAAPDSSIPTVGASGAISGIMGAYLILYPRVRVHTLFVIVILVKVIPIPAWLVLLQWFGLQLLYGLSGPAGEAGVAFWAHIGGFVAGVILVKPFENRQLTEAKRSHVKIRREQIRGGGWW